MTKPKARIKQAGVCRKLLKIEVPKERIALAFEQIYKDIQKEAVVAGFRKGKAPLKMLTERYKDYANQRVIERLISDSYREVMAEGNLSPIGSPKIEKVHFKEGEPLSFEADVEVKPEVSLKNYKGGGLKIKKKKIEVCENDVKQSLENLREIAAQYKTVENRAVMEGDYILCDLEWKVNGASIDNRKDILLPVDKKLSQEVTSSLIGAVPPVRKFIGVNIDKNFPKQEYAGKSATLEIDIKKIQERQLPEVNDEFAIGLGPFKDLADLKEKIKNKIDFENQQSTRIDMESQVIESLLKSCSFQLPQSLVELEKKCLIEDTRTKFTERGYTKEQIEKELPLLQNDLELHAQRQVKTFFILQEIAHKEGISVSDQELADFIALLAKRQNNKDVGEFKKYLEKDNLIDKLYWQLQEAKVMQFLLDNAEIESLAAES